MGSSRLTFINLVVALATLNVIPSILLAAENKDTTKQISMPESIETTDHEQNEYDRILHELKLEVRKIKNDIETLIRQLEERKARVDARRAAKEKAEKN